MADRAPIYRSSPEWSVLDTLAGMIAALTSPQRWFWSSGNGTDGVLDTIPKPERMAAISDLKDEMAAVLSNPSRPEDRSLQN